VNPVTSIFAAVLGRWNSGFVP